MDSTRTSNSSSLLLERARSAVAKKRAEEREKHVDSSHTETSNTDSNDRNVSSSRSDRASSILSLARARASARRNQTLVDIPSELQESDEIRTTTEKSESVISTDNHVGSKDCDVPPIEVERIESISQEATQESVQTTTSLSTSPSENILREPIASQIGKPSLTSAQQLLAAARERAADRMLPPQPAVAAVSHTDASSIFRSYQNPSNPPSTKKDEEATLSPSRKEHPAITDAVSETVKESSSPVIKRNTPVTALAQTVTATTEHSNVSDSLNAFSGGSESYRKQSMAKRLFSSKIVPVSQKALVPRHAVDPIDESMTKTKYYEKQHKVVSLVRDLYPGPSLLRPVPSVSAMQHRLSSPESTEVASITTELGRWKDSPRVNTHTACMRICNAVPDQTALQVALGAAGVCRMLVSYLASVIATAEDTDFSKDETAIYLQTCLRAVSVLMKCGRDVNTICTDNVRILVNSGLHDVLGEILRKYVSEYATVELCLSVVAKLAVDNAVCSSLQIHGVCEGVVDALMYHRNRPTVVENALESILNLCPDESCARICSPKTLSFICTELSTCGETTAALSCGIIGTFASHESMAGLVAESDACSTIVRLLKMYSSSSMVQEHAMYALGRLNLASCDDISSQYVRDTVRVAMETSRGKPCVLRAALSVIAIWSGFDDSICATLCETLDEFQGVVDRALTFLAMHELIECCQTASDILRERGACRKLPSVLEEVFSSKYDLSTQSAIVETICTSFCAFTVNCRENRELFIQMNIHEIIIAALLKYSKKPRYCSVLFRCVCNLCSTIDDDFHNEIVNKFLDIDIQRLLMAQISEMDTSDTARSDEICDAVCDALNVVSIFSRLDRYRDHFDQSRVRLLTGLLKNNSDIHAVRESACSCIATLVHDARIAIEFVALGTDMLLLSILESYYSDYNCIVHVCSALQNMLRHVSNDLSLIQSNFFSNLVRTLDSHSEHKEVLVHGVMVLNDLVQSNPSVLSQVRDSRFSQYVLNGIRAFNDQGDIVQWLCTGLRKLIDFYSLSDITEVCFALTQALALHSNEPAVCSDIIGTVGAVLSLHTEHGVCDSLGSVGICQLLVRNLRTSQTDPAYAALLCRTLASLCDRNIDNVMRCVEADGCAVLLTAMQLSYADSNSELCLSSSLAMCSMLSAGSRIQKAFGLLGACESVVLGTLSSWTTNDISVKTQLIWCIYYLSMPCPDLSEQSQNLPLLIKAGGAKAVCNCLKRFGDFENVVEAGCAAAKHLVLNDSGRSNLENEGLPLLILKFFTEFSNVRDVMVQCSGVLCRIMESASVMSAMLDGGTIKSNILSILKRFVDSDAICVSCFRMLISFFTAIDDSRRTINQSAFIDMDVCSTMVSALKQHSECTEVYQEACHAVFSLVQGNIDAAMIFGSHGVCEAVCNGLNVHFCDPVAVSNACLAISGLAYCKSNKIKIGRAGTCERILSLLAVHSNSADVARNACLAIQNLSSDCDENSGIFGGKGACEIVTSILEEHMTNSGVAAAVSGAIMSLTSTNRENSLRMGSENTCFSVLQTLSSANTNDDETVVLSSLAAIVSLSIGNVANQLEFGTHGTCEVLVDMLHKWSCSPVVVAAVLSAMVALCQHGRAHTLYVNVTTERFVEAGAGRVILAQLLNNLNNVEICCSGCNILYYLLSCSATLFASFNMTEMCTLLTTLISKHTRSAAAVEHACALAELVLLSSVETCTVYSSLDSIIPLVDAFRLHSGKALSEDACLNACKVLSTLLEFGGETVAAAVDNTEYSILLVNIMDEKKVNPEFSSTGCITISRLLEYNKGTTASKLRKLGICEVIISILRRHTTRVDIAYNACEAICAMATKSEADQSRYGQAGACHAICDAIATHTDNPNFCKMACRTICSLSANHVLNKSTFGVSGACELIIDMLRCHSESEIVVMSGCMAARNLAGGHEGNVTRLRESAGHDLFSAIFLHFFSNVDILENCCAVLCSLLIGDNAFKCSVTDSGVSDAAIAGLYKYSENDCVLSLLCLLVANMCTSVSDNCDKLMSRGVCEALQFLMTSKGPDINAVHIISTAVAGLCSSEECVNRLLALRIGEYIVNSASDRHDMGPEASLSWCNAVYGLSSNTKASSLLNECGTVHKILTLLAMHSQHEDVVLAALEAMISVSHLIAIQEDLAKQGVGACVVSVLEKHPTCASVLYRGLVLLESMCQNDPGCCSEIAEKSCGELLNHTLRNFIEHQDVVMACLRVIRIVSDANSDAQALLSNVGICDSVSMVLTFYVSNMDVYVAAFRTVGALVTKNQINAEKFIEDGFVDRIVKLCEVNSDDTAHVICEVVTSLTESSSQCVSLLSTSCVPRFVVDTLKKHTEDMTALLYSSGVCAAACYAVASLCRYSVNESFFRTHSAREILVQCMNMYISNSVVATAACAAIESVTRSNLSNVQFFAQCGVCSALMVISETHGSCVKTTINMFKCVTSLFEMDSSSVLPLFVEDCRFENTFSTAIENFSDKPIVLSAVSGSIAAVSASGYKFSESSKLYTLLASRMVAYVESSHVYQRLCVAVSSLCSSSIVASERMGSHGICDILTNALLSYRNHDILICSISSTIKSMMTCPANGSRFGEECCLNLMEIIRATDCVVDVVTAVCTALSALCRENESNAGYVVENSGCTVLLNLLSLHQDSRDVVIAICHAFNSIRFAISSHSTMDTMKLKTLLGALKEKYNADGEVLASILWLLTLSTDDSKAGDTDQQVTGHVVKTLIDSLRTHMNDKGVVIQACHGVSSLVREVASIAETFCSMGLCSILCEAVSFHMSSADAIAALFDSIEALCTGYAGNLMELESGDFVEQLLQAFSLHDKDFSATISLCLMVKALSHSRLLSSIIIDAGMCELLVRLLSSYVTMRSDVCDSVCQALYGLARVQGSTVDRTIVLRLVSLGAVKIVFSVFKQYHSIRETVFSSLTLLSIFAYEIEGKVELSSCESTIAIIECIRKYATDVDICIDGLFVLRKLVQFGDVTNIEKLSSNDHCSTCIDTLNKHLDALDVAASGFAVVMALAYHSERNLSCLGSCGAVDTVLKGLTVYSLANSFVIECCVGIIAVFFTHGNYSSHLQSAEVYDVIIANGKMFGSSIGLAEQVLNAVIASIETDALQSEVWGACGISDLIVFIIHNHFKSPAVSVLACKAICLLVNSSHGNTILLSDADAPKAVSTVLQWNLGSDNTVCTHAVTAIRDMSKSNIDSSSAFALSGVCEMLVTYLNIVEGDVKRCEIAIECVWFLCIDNDMSKEKFAATTVMSTIVSAIDVWADQPSVVRVCCGAIWHLASNCPACRQKLRSLHAVERVERALKVFHSREDISKLGCGALWSLSLPEGSDGDAKIPLSSCRTLVDTVKGHLSDPDILQVSFRTIANMCQQHKSSSTALGAVGACETVCSALHEQMKNPHVVEAACNAISGLSSEIDNTKRFFSIGANQSICTAITTHLLHKSVIVEAFCTLCALLNDSLEIALELFECGLCDVVIHTLDAYPHDKDIHGAVFKLVGSVIEIVPSSASRFGVTGACEIVTSTLRSYVMENEGESSVHALYFMHSLCMDPDNMTKIAISGAFASMVEAANKFGCLEDVMISFSKMVQALTSENVPQRSQYQDTLGREGVCRALVGAIRVHLSKAFVVCEILRALISLCVGNTSNMSFFSECEGQEHIYMVLERYSDDESNLDVSKSACSLIVVMVGLQSTSEVLGKLGVCDLVVNVLRVASSALDIDATETVAYAIASLIRSNSGNQIAFGRNGATCELVVSILSGWARMSESTEEAALWVISLLCKHSRDYETVCFENVEQMRLAGAYAAVTSTLRNCSSCVDSARAGIHAMYGISCDSNTEHVSHLGAVGACETVVSVFENHMNDQDIIEAASNVVANLCIAESNLELLRELQIVSFIGKATSLYADCPTAVASVCCAIKNIANDDSFRTLMCQLGICDFVASSLKIYACSEKRVLRSILEAVKALTQCTDSCSAVLEESGIDVTMLEAILPMWMEQCDADMTQLVCEVVRQLSDHSSENCFRVYRANACESMTAVIKLFPCHAAIVSQACAVVRLLALNCDDSIEIFSSLGMQDLLVDALQHFENDAEAAQDISKALQVIITDKATRADIGLRSASEAVVKALRRGMDNPSATEQNCVAVVKLLVKNRENTRILIDLGVCELCATLLRKHIGAEAAIVQILSAIETICEDEKTIPLMGDAGVCTAVASVFRRHSNSVNGSTVVHCSLRVIDTLAVDSENCVAFGLAGCCEIVSAVLSTAINDDDEKTAMSCARAIFMLCRSTASNAEAFGVAGVCVHVSSALNGMFKGSSTLEYLLLALAFLCRQDGESEPNSYNLNAFYNLKTDKFLMKALSIMKKDPRVTKAACIALDKIAGDAESGLRLTELGACQLLPSLLESYATMESDVAVSIVGAMERLAISGRNVMVLVDNGTVPALIELFKVTKSDYKSVARCCTLIKLLIIHDEELVDVFVKGGICELVVNTLQDHEDLPVDVVVSGSAVISRVAVLRTTIARLGQSNIAIVLLNLFKRFESNERTVSAISSAVSALVIDATVSAQFVKSGWPDMLVSSLRRHMKISSIVQNATSIISCMLNSTAQAPSVINMFRDAGLCEVILGIARKYSENPDIAAKFGMIISVLSLDDSLSVILGTGGACETIVNSLNIFSNDVRVAHCCCKATRNLSCNIDNRSLLVSLGAIEHVLSMLRRFVHTEKVTAEACGALVNLFNNASTDHTHERSRILGASGEIVKALVVQVDSAVVVEQVCRLLCALAMDESSREVLGVHDVCRSLSIALEKHFEAENIAEGIMGAVSRIAYKSSDNKSLFSKTNVAKYVISAYEAHCNSIGIAENCCRAITALSTNDDVNSDAFGENGACEMITGIISHHNSNAALCGYACQTAVVLMKRSSNITQLIQCGMSKCATSALKQHLSQSSVRHTCAAVALLGKVDTEASILCETGVSALLARVLVAHSSDRAIVQAASLAVTSLADNSERCSIELGSEGVCDALVSALRSHLKGAAICTHIMTAMVALAAQSSNGIRLGNPSVFDLVVTGLRVHINDYAAILVCCSLLSRIIHTESSKSAAGASGVCEGLAIAFEQYEDDRGFVTVASEAVAGFALNCPVNADRCAKTKLCLMIFRALESHMNHSEVAAALFLAVKALAITVLNRRFFGGGDGCELIKIVMLKNADSELACINSCEAVSAIAFDSQENKEMYGKIGMCDAIVKVLRNYKENVDIVVAATSALSVLCTDSVSNTEKVSREGALEVLVACFRFHCHNPDVSMSISKLLICLLRHKKGSISSLRVLDVRELVVASIDEFCNRPMTVMFCLRLLRDMYACEEEGNSLDPLNNECLYLTAVLKANISNMVINEDACSVIFLLSRKRMSRSATVFGDCGACELISNVMSLSLEHRNVSLAKMAMLAMVSLCTGNSSNQEKFGDNNSCGIVVSVLQRMGGDSASSSPEMEGAALNAIAMLARHSKSISSENAENIQKLMVEGACEIVVSCLERRLNNMPLVYSACRAIFCLAGNETCSHRFIRCGACDVIVRVLRQFEEYSEIAQYACGAVANLAFVSEGAVALHRTGVCEPLVNVVVINRKDPHLVEYGCKAIKNLSVDAVDISAALGAGGVCKTLMTVLKIHFGSSALLPSILMAIANIVIGIPLHAESVLNANIDQKILKVIDDFLPNENICGCAVAVLANLCDHEFTKHQMRECGVPAAITKVLCSHTASQPMVIRCCIALVRVLEDTGECSQPFEYKDAELCNCIVRALQIHAGSDVTTDAVFKCLVRLGAYSPYNRDKLMTAGAGEKALHILSKNVRDPTVAAQICRVVHFLAFDAPSKSLLRQSGACERILMILQTHIQSEDMVHLVGIALLALAHDCAENRKVLLEKNVCEDMILAIRSHCTVLHVGKVLCDAISCVVDGDVSHLKEHAVHSFSVAVSTFFQRFWENKDCCHSACHVVSLLSNIPECQVTFEKCGICDQLILAIQEHSLCAETVSLCCDTCIALSRNREVIPELGSLTACQVITNFLRAHATDAAVVLSGFQLVRILCTNATIRARLGDVGICECVVRACRKHQTFDTVIEAGFAVMRALATNVQSNKVMLGESGACAFIVETLKFGICSPQQIEVACAAIASLANCGTECNNVSALDQAGIVTVLVEIFQSHIGSSSIMKQVCTIVSHLAMSPQGPNKKLGELEICDKTVMALATHMGVNGVNSVICSCVRALAQNGENKILMGSSGCCNIVTKLLGFSIENDDFNLVEESLLTIASLVHGSCSNQEAFGLAGACELVSELVGDQNDIAVNEKSLWCVAYLCRSGLEPITTSERNINTFHSSGVVESILDLMRKYKDNENLIVPACWSLRSMCFVQAIAKAVLASRGLDTLCAVLRTYMHESRVIEAVCFASAAVLAADHGMSLGSSGICELVVRAMQRHMSMPTVVDRCCSCIANLCSQGSEYRHRFGNEGACAIVARAMRLHLRLKRVAEESCGAVWNLSIENPDNRIKFGCEGVCETIVDIVKIHENDVYVKNAAMGALKALSVDCEENARRINACRGVDRQLVDSSSTDFGVSLRE